MFTKLTQFFKILRDTRLTDAERDAFRADFISYIRVHPYEKRRKESPFLTLAYFLFKKPVAITLCLALVVLGTTSVARASQNALPGDALYPIKVNVTEEIKAAFLPKEEKARFEIERTARRIEEATELARNGRLTPESAQIVQAQIEQHAKTISELTKEIKAEGDAKIAADIHTELEATLAVNEQIFTDVVQQENIKTEETQILVAVIEAAQEGDRRLKEGAVKESVALFQEAKTRAKEVGKIAETSSAPQVSEPPPVSSQRPATVSSEEPEKRTPIIETPLPRVNTPPKIITYPPPPKGATTGSELAFTWEAFDPEDDTLQWEVWWGDMEKRENQEVCETAICSRISASHTWNSPGSYTVRVRVSDDKGESDGYSFTITIQAAEPKEPERIIHQIRGRQLLR